LTQEAIERFAAHKTQRSNRYVTPDADNPEPVGAINNLDSLRRVGRSSPAPLARGLTSPPAVSGVDRRGRGFSRGIVQGELGDERMLGESAQAGSVLSARPVNAEPGSAAAPIDSRRSQLCRLGHPVRPAKALKGLGRFPDIGEGRSVTLSKCRSVIVPRHGKAGRGPWG